MENNHKITPNERICKRCASKPKLTEADIEKMVAQVTSMRGIRLVDSDEYERRMKICTACEKFEYGSTCTICGCVMQVRARLSDGRCPFVGGSRW